MHLNYLECIHTHTSLWNTLIAFGTVWMHLWIPMRNFCANFLLIWDECIKASRKHFSTKFYNFFLIFFVEFNKGFFRYAHSMHVLVLAWNLDISVLLISICPQTFHLNAIVYYDIKRFAKEFLSTRIVIALKLMQHFLFFIYWGEKKNLLCIFRDNNN